MKIQIENSLTRESDIYEVGRIPCVGESVTIDEETTYEVKHVIHFLNKNPETQVLAIVRVR